MLSHVFGSKESENSAGFPYLVGSVDQFWTSQKQKAIHHVLQLSSGSFCTSCCRSKRGEMVLNTAFHLALQSVLVSKMERAPYFYSLQESYEKRRVQNDKGTQSVVNAKKSVWLCYLRKVDVLE